MKLWNKGVELDKEIESFTVGNDYLLDKKLIKFDCISSISHAKMLNKIGILTGDELNLLVHGLNKIIKLDDNNEFFIEQNDEDCHTAIENYLIKESGDVGKKIHTGRSRNDQVLTAIRLYEKKELTEIIAFLKELEISLKSIIEKYGDIELPGYTHMQKAMPTTVLVWLGSFIATIKDDLNNIICVLELIDQNPLGSAAGFGVPVIEIDKEFTTFELGFKKVMQNPMYAQLSRGKFEGNILNSLTSIMFTINKMSTDLMLFSMQEFDFIKLPKKFCTGSSIMPQKKNPDVLELLRAKYHIVLGYEFQVKSLISNLMSGYNRDIQLTKEPMIKSFEETKKSLNIMALLIQNLKINEQKCKNAMTDDLYATKKVYELVKKGISFREAYKQISKEYGDD